MGFIPSLVTDYALVDFCHTPFILTFVFLGQFE